jgi:two-component system nitrogen regulation sensor histidine kinase NtrY
MTKSKGTDLFSKQGRRIRNNILVLVTLLALIVLQITFLFGYSGFTTWQTIDANLVIFVAVNVNIVLLTAVFYLILRHLFKLAYERRTLSGVSLRTKLIVAFLMLSLPSTAFHLTASGFIAQLFKSWSVGEYQQVLENSRVVMNSLNDREHRLLRLTAERILAGLPTSAPAYRGRAWMERLPAELVEGVYVYDRGGKLLGHWMADPAYSAYTGVPPAEYFQAREGFYWIERFEDRQVHRLLMPIPGSPQGLNAEVIRIEPTVLSQAVMRLEIKEHGSAVLGRDLLLLVLTILVGITLLIIFAATWIAFYFARGFVAPVERLAEATRRVSAGELGYEVQGAAMGPLKSDFEGLVNAFNAMSRQLKQQHVQLLDTAENLRRSHRELGERNRFVELLLENIDLGIVSLSPDGTVSTLNRSAQRLIPPRVEPSLHRHYRVVFDREVATLLDEMLERARQAPHRPATKNLTLVGLRRQVHVEVSTLPLETGEGEHAGVVVMIEDVSNFQRTQRALAWREVARRVAHEIKNPLTPIQLSAQRIRRRYLDALGEDGMVLDQCTQTIINEVSSLKMMVNEFSQFAKLPESRLVPGDLNGVIRELARFYESGLPDSIRLALELDEGLPRLPLDSEQMKRVFTNLIDNAAASIRGQGTIALRTAFLAEAHTVLAEVADDGSGVPEELRGRLFEPYTSTKEGGTGLGLAIVNQIVSDHNGFVRYADRKPHGSVFSIELPVR